MKLPGMPKLPALAGVRADGHVLAIRLSEVLLVSGARGKMTGCIRSVIEQKDASGLSLAVQSLVSQASLKDKRLAVMIPTQDVLFRFFSMPAMPKNEWEAAVQFEARKYIPFKIDGLIWDYYVGPSTTPEKLDVVFAAIPKENFQMIQDVLASAGIQPTLIEPRTLSLARLLGSSAPENDNQFHCVVELDQDTAHIAIVKNQIPYLARDIGMHARPGASEPEAVVGAPIVQPDVSQVGVDHRLQRLASELSVSIDFFLREYGAASISRVVVFADEERIESWLPKLSNHLQCPVEPGTSFVPSIGNQKKDLRLASAVGLLQAASDVRRAPINFLRRSAAKATPAQTIKTGLPGTEELLEIVRSPQILVVGALALAFLGALHITTSQWVPSVQRELDQLVQSRPDLGWNLHTLSSMELEPIRGQVQEQMSRLKGMIDETLSVAEKLDALARSLPDGIWLTKVDFEHRLDLSTKALVILNVDGSCYLKDPASELIAIQKFEETLRQNSIFLKGMAAARVEQINAELQDNNVSYRSFELRCGSERRL